MLLVIGQLRACQSVVQLVGVTCLAITTCCLFFYLCALHTTRTCAGSLIMCSRERYAENPVERCSSPHTCAKERLGSGSSSCCRIFPLLLASLVLIVTPLAVVVEGQPILQPFQEQNAAAHWSARAFAFTFSWMGGMWVAGGTSAQDVWFSYDYGNSWFLSPTTLPGPCWSTDSQGIVYANTVYLMCAFEHGATGSPVRSPQLSYMNKSPFLSEPWRPINSLDNEYGNDGLTDGRTAFSVNHMAVPWDGIGTLILINGELNMWSNDIWGHTTAPVNTLCNDVWWLSATKRWGGGTAFQAHKDINTWYPFQDSTTTQPYTAPWPARSRQTTVTDSEGSMMIMAGGFGYSGELNDVWQMSWALDKDGVHPRVYPLLTAQWSPRFNAALYNYKGFFYLYGGEDNAPTYYDDLWISTNYGMTWSEVRSSATGIVRSGIDPLVFSNRFFIVAGQNSDSSELHDVWSSRLHY